jgi:hypothetical protein
MGENNMYTLQDFLNTLSHAGVLIRITINGTILFQGKQIEFGVLLTSIEYMNYKVWSLEIFDDKYLEVNISK